MSLKRGSSKKGKSLVRWTMREVEDAVGLYEELYFMRRHLNLIGEHGLASLVNDRMTAVQNFIPAEERKALAIKLYKED